MHWTPPNTTTIYTYVIFGSSLSTPLVIGYLLRILVPAGGPAEDFLSSTGFCLTMDFLGALTTHYRATGSLGIAGIRYVLESVIQVEIKLSFPLLDRKPLQWVKSSDLFL